MSNLYLISIFSLGLVWILHTWLRAVPTGGPAAHTHIIFTGIALTSAITLLTPASNVLLAAAYAASWLVALYAIPSRARSYLPLTLALTSLIIWLLLMDIAHHGVAGASLGKYAGSLFALALILRFLRGGTLGTSTATWGLVALLVLGSAAGLARGTSFRPCDEFKCGPLDELYTAGFGSENLPAALAGYALLTLLMAPKQSLKGRPLAIAYLALVLAGTGSRTPLLAGAAALIWWLVFSRWRPNRVVATSVLVATFASIFAVSLTLWSQATPDSYSNRGRTWLQARNVISIEDAWTTGVGGGAWERYQELGTIGIHFAHSQYVLLVFSGGFIALALYSLAFVIRGLDLTRDTGGRLESVTTLVYVLTLGLMEVTWNVGGLDGLTVLSVVVFAAQPDVGSNGSVPEERSIEA